jgi:Flp pilus assembly pilin Flp
VISNIRRLTRRDEGANESGQALVEYALILMLIAFVAFAGLEAIGTHVAEALLDAAAGFGGA